MGSGTTCWRCMHRCNDLHWHRHPRKVATAARVTLTSIALTSLRAARRYTVEFGVVREGDDFKAFGEDFRHMHAMRQMRACCLLWQLVLSQFSSLSSLFRHIRLYDVVYIAAFTGETLSACRCRYLEQLWRATAHAGWPRAIRRIRSVRQAAQDEL